MADDHEHLTAGMFIRQERSKQGRSLEEVASHLGNTRNWLSLIERGQIKMKVGVFAKLCAVLGVTPPSSFINITNIFDNEEEVLSPGELESMGVREKKEITPIVLDKNDRILNINGADYISVPVMDVIEVGVNRYDENSNITIYEKFAQFELFRVDWLKTIVRDYKKTAAIFVEGDGMYPTLKHGDMVLIDQSVERIAAEAVYIIEPSNGGDPIIMKCRRDVKTGKILIASGNDAYQTEALADSEIRVVGRVAWFGRRM